MKTSWPFVSGGYGAVVWTIFGGSGVAALGFWYAAAEGGRWRRA
jgi:hypothetical protein